MDLDDVLQWFIDRGLVPPPFLFGSPDETENLSGFGFEPPFRNYPYNPPVDQLYPGAPPAPIWTGEYFDPYVYDPEPFVPESARFLAEAQLGYNTGFTPEFRNLLSTIPVWQDPDRPEDVGGYYAQRYIDAPPPSRASGGILAHELGHAWEEQTGVDLDAFDKDVKLAIATGVQPDSPYIEELDFISRYPGPAKELYATLISRSGGDLNKIPTALQPHFNKALSPSDVRAPYRPFPATMTEFRQGGYLLPRGNPIRRVGYGQTAEASQFGAGDIQQYGPSIDAIRRPPLGETFSPEPPPARVGPRHRWRRPGVGKRTSLSDLIKKRAPKLRRRFSNR